MYIEKCILQNTSRRGGQDYRRRADRRGGKKISGNSLPEETRE
jgi:hypothetical protein